MKRFMIICAAMFFAFSAIAQRNTTQLVENIIDIEQDSVVPWTGNMIGLNVYPAFGMLGGSVLSTSKIFLQYRHMWKKTNLRLSANYINYYQGNDRLDVVGVQDSLINFRDFTNLYYTFDFRVGVERAYYMDKFRFYFGMGIITGYHYFGKEYFLYDKPFEGYPVENISSPIVYEKDGWYRADMLKVGADITLGVDLLLSENVILSLQYAPEIAYFKRIASDRNDADNVFVGDVEDYFDFRADFFDVVLSIGF